MTVSERRLAVCFMRIDTLIYFRTKWQEKLIKNSAKALGQRVGVIFKKLAVYSKNFLIKFLQCAL